MPNATPEYRRQRTFSKSGTMAFEVIALGTVLAASAAPTPLYRVYQQHWGLSPLTLTVIFAVYSFSLLFALISAGSLSDYIGRRPVICVALVMDAVAMGLFAGAESATALACARVLQGFATGAANAAICAAILDNDRTHGSLVNSVAPIAGLGVGALGSGALVAYAPAPEQLVYLVLIAIFALQAVLIWFVPETVERRPGALASLVPRINLPKYARSAFLLITPNNVAMWALLGFYLSLMPSLVANVIASGSPLVGGVVVATLTFAAAAGIVAVRHWHAMAILVRSSSALILGVAVTMLGAYLKMFSVIFVGTLIAGGGFGPAFFGSMRTIMPLAEPSERAGLLSTIFIVCYLSMSLPTIAAGLFVPVLGLATTTYVYGGGVIVLSVISLTAIVISIRRARIGDAHPHHK